MKLKGDGTNGFQIPSWYTCRFRRKPESTDSHSGKVTVLGRPGGRDRLPSPVVSVSCRPSAGYAGAPLQTPQPDEPQGSPSPFLPLIPTCFQNSLEATDNTLSSTKLGALETFVKAAAQQLGSTLSLPSLTDIISSIPCLHPILATSLLPICGLPLLSSCMSPQITLPSGPSPCSQT